MALACVVAAGLSAPLAQAASAAPAGRWELTGSRPAWAVPAKALRPLPGAELLAVDVYLGWRDPDGARALAAAVSDPAGAAYHHYLSPPAFTSAYGPTTDSAARVVDYLRAQGLRSLSVPADRRYVHAVGTVAQLDAAFGTRLTAYRVGGRVLRAPAAEPSLPDSLDPDVIAVGGLDDGDTVAPAGLVATRPGAGCTPVTGGSGGGCGDSPAQLQQAYLGRAAGRAAGRGQTVAVLTAAGSPTLRADVTRFSAQHRLPAPRLRATGPAPTAAGDPGWAATETVSVEAVHALAPAARLLTVHAPAASLSGLDEALNTLVQSRRADVVTLPYGVDEAAVAPRPLIAYTRLLWQAAAEGVTVIAADGRTPSAPTGVSYPAVDPWVTAVGGTRRPIAAGGGPATDQGWPAGRPQPVAGQAQPVPASSRGTTSRADGRSALFDPPAWQQPPPAGTAAAGTTAVTGGRLVPDVALLADPAIGMATSLTSAVTVAVTVARRPRRAAVPATLSVGGGTALSAALLAGVAADANAQEDSDHGLLTPLLYAAAAVGGLGPVAAAQAQPGQADTGTSSTGGWDPLTGIGVPTLDALTAAALSVTRQAGPGGPLATGVPLRTDGPVGADHLTPATEYLKRLVTARYGLTDIGGWRPGDTKYGTDHATGRALDVMLLPVGPASTVLGNRITVWLQAHAAQLDISYLIWRQRIWSPTRAAEGWRPMEDRGSPTANHMDHVHISLN